MPEKTEPGDGTERALLVGWLTFHRATLAEKCADLADDQLVLASAPPSPLSLLGLVRHLTIMERVYITYALGAADFDLIYCTDDDPEGDIALDGIGLEDVAPSIERWRAEQGLADAALAGVSSLDEVRHGNHRSVRWNFVKVIGEYSRHNGHADLLRERIDGRTGE